MHKFFKPNLQIYSLLKKFVFFFKKHLHFLKECDTILLLSDNISVII